MKVVLLGTAYPYRGGLASFNERLIREFQVQGHEAAIITFTLQYPAFLFPGTTQFSTSPPPEDLKIQRKVNAVNPLNWWLVGRQLQKDKPDILILKYWLPFMAPCFGTIARLVRKNKHTKVICIADNIIPHEPKFYDSRLTKFFIHSCDGFVTMSEQVLKDLARFDRKKMRASNPHPLFDNFGAVQSKESACAYLDLNSTNKYILFFGFIRDYKGLDLLLQAMNLEELQDPNTHLIIAGEFYTDKQPYLHLINEKLSGRIHWFDRFIPDEEVKYFFSAADLVVQPYKHATQSGVTQIAYHFEVPMVVTNVGGLPELVPDGECGFVVPPEAQAIASAIQKFFETGGRDTFLPGIRNQKMRFGWDRMVQTIVELRKKL
jgi:D-inositol-3-phosphate glycosyltransferase